MEKSEYEGFCRIVKEKLQEDLSKHHLDQEELKTIDEICKKLGVKTDENLNLKIQKLYYTQKVRNACCLIGNNEKSEDVVKVLLELLANEIKIPVDLHKVNDPDDTGDRYGVTDRSKFTDLRIDTVLRNINENKTNESKKFHVIFINQPINAHWIENYNSLLDDNKVFITNKSERLPLNSNTRLVFTDLRNFEYTTPASVSRFGVIYLE